MPLGVEDRRADVWEPLLAIADAAGGDWPTMARKACLELNAEMMEDDGSWGVRFLHDVRQVFADSGFPDRIRSSDLIEKLRLIDESPWDDLTPYKLSAKLKPFGVAPRQHRFEDKTAKGYLRSELEDPWSRYLPPLSLGEVETSGTSETPSAETPRTGETQGVTDPPVSGVVSDVSPVSDFPGGDGVTGTTGSDGPEEFTLW